MVLTNNEIVNQVLIKLDGWVLSDRLIESESDINDDDTENNIDDSINVDDVTDILDSDDNTETEILITDNTTEDEILNDLEYNKKITSREILQFYNDASEYSKSYLQRTDTEQIPVYDTAIIFWTAGLIWEKYNQKENNMLDDTNPNPWGYGDKLIIQAKEMLKPYKVGFVFRAF